MSVSQTTTRTPFEAHVEGDVLTVRFGPVQTVREIAGYIEGLKQTIYDQQSCNYLKLDSREVTEADYSFFQLLLSFTTTFRESASVSILSSTAVQNRAHYLSPATGDWNF